MTDPDSKKYKHLPLVPESVLRRRHDLDDLHRKRQALVEEGHVGNVKKRRVMGNHFYVKKPESFLARARSRRNAAIRFRRVLKKGMQKKASNKPVFKEKVVEEENNDETETTSAAAAVVKYQANSVGARFVFVIRIRDHQGTPRCVSLTLRKLRLKTLHTGVFVRYTPEMQKKLQTVEPWIVYGRPSTSVIQDLIERRGCGTVTTDEQGKYECVPLSDNMVIEEQLGDKYGIICKEDLVHEIDTAGEHFEVCAKFLWPFRLLDSKSEYERQTLKLKDGKDYGDRGEEINEYIQQVL